MPTVAVSTMSGKIILRNFPLTANKDVITLWADVGKTLGTLHFDFTFGLESVFHIDDSVSALPQDCILTAVILPDIEDVFYSLPPEQKEQDPYIGITVKIDVKGAYVRGEVHTMVIGRKSGEKLYYVKFEDGNVEDYTLKQLLVFADPRVDAVATKQAWAGKVRCSACKKEKVLTALKNIVTDDEFRILLCMNSTCKLMGYWYNPLRTHHCGLCGVAGTGAKFELSSLQAHQQGFRKRCLQCVSGGLGRTVHHVTGCDGKRLKAWNVDD